MSEKNKRQNNKSAEKSGGYPFRQLPFDEKPVSVFYNAAADLLGADKLEDSGAKSKDGYSK